MKTVKYTLSDNVVVETAARKSSTGYVGSSFSTAWTLDDATPFVAHAPRTSQYDAGEYSAKAGGQVQHLGYYADSREAAYVAARFKSTPREFARLLSLAGGVWKEFPSDLYSLPVKVTAQEVREGRAKPVTSHSLLRDLYPLTKVEEAAHRVWKAHFGDSDFKALVKEASKLEVENDLKFKTWGDFAKKYKLA